MKLIIDLRNYFIFGLICGLCLSAGYYAGKVSVYEQQAGIHKVVKGDSALPELFKEGKELR